MMMSQREIGASSAASARVFPLRMPAQTTASSFLDVQPQQAALDPIALAVVALDRHYRLKQPILVAVTSGVDGVTVVDGLVSRFGEGATCAEAVSDYASNLLDYFRLLRERRDRLSPRLALHLSALEDRIQEA